MCNGWGVKSVENLIASINNAKSVSLEKWIYSLGIRHIGAISARAIAGIYHSATKFLQSMILISNNDESEVGLIKNYDGFGESAINGIREFFSIEENRAMVCDLIDLLKIVDYKSDYMSDYGNVLVRNIFHGKTIVFTGTMRNFSRNEAKELAIGLGAKIGTSVSKNVHILVCGANAGSKLKTAYDLGIHVINEDEWIQMIKM
jgi:DNA ligase (NAD+)